MTPPDAPTTPRPTENARPKGRRRASLLALVAAPLALLSVPSCGATGTTTDSVAAVDEGAGGEGGASGKAGSSGKGGKGGASSVAGGEAGGGAGGSSGEGGLAGAGGVFPAGSSGASGGAGAGGSAVKKLGPPYPVVLAHGFFGFEKFAGVGFITYFYKVKDHLADKGETLVFTPAVDPFNSSEVRGKALEKAIEDILAQTGHEKVNVIGHSQGGLDARVVAHNRPDLVASVTTVATPHQGTPVSDVALKVVSDPNFQALIDQLVKVISLPLYDAAGNTTSLSKSMYQFSQAGIESFNAVYTDQPGITYQSFTGRSKLHDGGKDCQAPNAPSFITKWNPTRDTLEPLLSVPGVILDGDAFNPQPHDGLVRVKDAKWGMFLGCIPADHFDEIGHLFGDSPGPFNDWDYLEFYEEVVKMLRKQGF